MKLFLLKHKLAHLDSVDGKVKRVVDDDIMGGGDGALAYVLRHQEEVVPIPLGDCVVHNGAGGRIVQLLTRLEAWKKILVLILFWLVTGFSTQNSFLTAEYLSSLGVGMIATTIWTWD